MSISSPAAFRLVPALIQDNPKTVPMAGSSLLSNDLRMQKPYTLGPRYYSPGGWNQDVVAMQEHHRLLSLQIPGCQFLHNNQVGFPLFLYLDLNTSYKKYRNVLSEKGWKIQSSVIL